MSKRGENIYKRKDNRWEARYIKEYRADGSAKFGYCYGKTYKEAKQKVVNARTALYLGNSPKVDKLDKSFDSFCDEWILLKRNKVTESTLIKYSNTIKNHIKPHFNNCQLSYFSTQSISNFCDHLVRDKKLASKTVKDILNVLNAILKHIRKEIPTLFANTEITYPKRTKKEIRILSLCEQKSLMTFLLKETDNFKLATALALMTGLRIGEICALRWGDISLEEKTLKVKYTMQRLQNFENNTLKKTKIVITEPKSPTSLRTIPLTDFATELCKKHYVSNPEAFLLTSKPDKFVEPRILQNKFSKYVSALGFEDVHFHTLRHTFATRCVEVNFEIKSLSEILGHSSPRITLERYVHSSINLKRDNMKKLDVIGF